MLGKGRETVLSKARKELRESIIAIAPIFASHFHERGLSLLDCVAPILWRLKEVDITLPERSTKPLHRYVQSSSNATLFVRA